MLGTDIVSVKRIEKLLHRHPQFLDKVFSPQEIAYIKERKHCAERVAGMFAAKEAMSKAMGSGIGKNSFLDFQILYVHGKPYGMCKGVRMNLSISHEREYAIAVAQIAEEKSFVLREDFRAYFPKRKRDTHKGDYGKLGIVAGSLGMTGAPTLAAMAALRTGAGLVYNVVEEELVPILSLKLTEAVIRSFPGLAEEKNFLDSLNAVVLGPGMGTSNSRVQETDELLTLEKNMLVDADGITNLSKLPGRLTKRRPYTTVITPHVGEFARISGYSIEEIQRDGQLLAQEFAAREQVVVVLKGHHTVVTDGRQTYINDTGNPGMATAGSGDVLSGIIGALLCRMDVFSAAKAGVYLHGLAGDCAAAKVGEDSLIAGDIVLAIQEVLRF